MTDTDPGDPAHGHARVGQTLLTIMGDVPILLDAERATLFLHQPETDELWSLVAVGDRSIEIRIKADVGIAGHVMQTGETALVRDPYADPRFNPEVDRRSGFTTRQILCQPVVTESGERIGVIQVLNKISGPFDDTDDRMLRGVARQAATSLENARLYDEVRRLRDAERDLLRQLEAQHRRLQEAFVAEEEANRHHKARWRGVALRRWAGVVGLVLTTAGLGWIAQARFGLVEQGAGWLGSVTGQAAAPAAGLDDGTLSFVEVVARPIQDWSRLVGRLEPIAWINVVSPLNSVLLTQDFRYGQLVEKDQLLASLDSAEHQVKLREADSQLIVAREEMLRLEGWGGSVEVIRARRDLANAESMLASTRRQHGETRRLHDEGIVARNELESSEVGLRSQQNQVVAAQEALAATQAQGGPEKRRMAELRLQNAQAQYDQVRADLGRTLIRSPATGIIFPVGEGQEQGQQSRSVGVGTSVSRNMPMFAIADMTGVAVNSLVDELQVLSLRLGQRARITVDAVPGLELDAIITGIAGRAAGQGRQGQQGNEGPARFEVGMVVAGLSDEQRAIVRIGMTATARVLTYDNPQALMVPFEAIQIAGDQRYVSLRMADGSVQSSPVVIRGTLLDGVEIASGVAAGDRVALAVTRP